MTKLIFLVILFFANVLQAVTGFAGTVAAMPPASYLLGLENTKVILNVTSLISGLFIACMNFRNIKWKEFFKIIIFMTAGMAVGIKICSFINSEDILLKIYGIIILLVVFKNTVLKKSCEMPEYILILVLILAGIIHGMFVSGGALLVIYAVQVLKNKDEFRATLGLTWAALNSFMMFSEFKNGLFTSENTELIFLSIIPLFAAVWLGGKISKKIDKNIFLKLTYILLGASGLSLIF